MTDTGKAWLQIHFCVFLWGFTAIIGKLITIPAVPLVMWRMLLVAAMLLCAPRVWRGLSRLSGRQVVRSSVRSSIRVSSRCTLFRSDCFVSFSIRVALLLPRFHFC